MIESQAITDLIKKASSGDHAALRSVFDASYADLRRMARLRLSKGGRGTMLDTTALVHESFLRLAGAGCLQIHDRQHFMRYASQVMRSVIVDCVRERLAERRGGGSSKVALDTHIYETYESLPAAESEILQVHEALEELAQLDERLGLVVEMRYFAGMTEAEIAEALEVTERTVRRDWEKARLLLAGALKK